MKFTVEQQQAINANEKNILVSAAAGSGKTSVLVQRILTLVEDNVDIDKLLVMTFTEAAAAEMKDRIAEALQKKIEDEPGNSNLLRQAALLPAASISTMHSFCLRLVRDYFHHLDIDPGFRIGDNVELNLIKSSVMEELFEESYNSREGFADLAETFGGGKHRDIRLDDLIRRLYSFMESRPFPEDEAEKYLSYYDAPLNESVWADIIKNEISTALETAAKALKTACDMCRIPEGPEKYLLTFSEDEALINRLQNAVQSGCGIDGLYDIFTNIKHEKIYVYRGKEKEAVDDELRQKVKDIRDGEIKKRIDRIKTQLFFAPPEKIINDIKRVQPVIKTLFELTADFRSRYRNEKRVRNLVDFNDLEHFAIKILQREASVIAERFDEVLIDEYQDTNEVQGWILSAITGEKNVRHFMVGDIKQSIYGFRHAEPGLFLNKLNNPSVRSILLSQNFRSSSSVVNAVNFFFNNLMEGYMDLIPVQTDKNHAVELHVVNAENDDDESDEASLIRIRREAGLIADCIRKLNRPHKDIVILTRSVSSTAADLVEELKQQGIYAAAEIPGGFFKTPEIMTALSLLRVVDNPRQDIDLLAVMRLYGFSPDEMMAVRLYGGNGEYYDCLKAYAENGDDENLRKRLVKMADNINKWRKNAVKLPISRLISLLYEEAELIYYFGSMAGGEVRRANLIMLLEKAISYENTSFTGLFHFLRYIEWLKDNSDDENEAVTLPEDADVVRVMTIHKSKGLEFPVVFVSQLGRQFNRMDERSGVIMHPEYGIGAMYTDLRLRTRANTAPRLALSLLRRNETIAEEQRILYVAMTRAKEKLILTGCVTGLADKIEKWKGISVPHEAKSYLDWLMPSALAEQGVVQVKIHMQPLSGADLTVKPETESKSFGKIRKILHPAPESLPSKLAISELKRIFALETTPDSTNHYEDDINFDAPAFYKNIEGQISHVRLGTILHTVIEHMDLHKDTDCEKIKALISKLTDSGLLTSEETDVIDINILERFSKSKLAERMRNARRLHRETPFVLGLSPDDIGKKGAGTILVHGIIDCYFVDENGNIILVDFKSGANPAVLEERYKTQMTVYRKAIERAEGKPVSESLFYSFN